jgi:phosphate starvation-inducible PhoH-like protein
MEESESLRISEERIELPTRGIQELLYANGDKIIHDIEENTDLYIAGRDSCLTLRGNETNLKQGLKIIQNIISLYQRNRDVAESDVTFIINKVKRDISFDLENVQSKEISIGPSGGKVISPKSRGQLKYFDAIRKNDLVFAIGPAGTGKTYLAMAFALHNLLAENISRIILTRPVVEAGENLGFLPGDLEQKVNPYLRPLYDAIYDMIPYTSFRKFVERGAIEVAPLAYMRGRTLHDSFIILDEAQNTTRGQMLMFLTRIGFNSKTVVTGDVTQSDLPKGRDSGLLLASRVLRHVEGVQFIHLGAEDVVRHPLVERIIHAFERYEGKGAT